MIYPKIPIHQRVAIVMPNKPGKWVKAHLAPTYRFGLSGIGWGTPTLKDWWAKIKFPFKCPKLPNDHPHAYSVYYILGRGFKSL